MIITPHAGYSVARREDMAAAFREDAVKGLRACPKQLPCKYFYDDVGARLFERICEVEEYYLTRTELAIMREHADDMAEIIGPACCLIEYGSGSGVKTRLLLDHLSDPVGYFPVDISGRQLYESARQLASAYPHLEVRPIWGDFTQSIHLPPESRSSRRVVYFPGSTLGNFTPDEAVTLLRRTARRTGPDGGMLLGVDLKKNPGILTRAYNDKAGISAAFNLNLLVRMNRELGADFQIDQFWHHAFYEPLHGRMEMHLISKAEQTVRLGTHEFTFAEGESIRTEYSYKYSLDDLESLAAEGGFDLGEIWMDEQRFFAVCFLRVSTNTHCG
jgi:dimethylhistidine N-methyltransferase